MWFDIHREKASKSRREASKNKIFSKFSSASNQYLKKLLIEDGLDYKCEECNNSGFHNEKPLTLQLDHKNGNSSDNRKENLRLLCPNCHSQTETYCGKGNTGKYKVNDALLIEALKTEKNIRQALLKVGLSAKGGNYKRAFLLKSKMAG